MVSVKSSVSDKSPIKKMKPVNPGDEVVITGIAGRFPDSDNMNILRENLYNKVDLITDDDRRWKLDHPEIPQRTGKVNDVAKFDALFFGVHFKQAHTMDPMCRILLEHTFEAIIDAGYNPRQLRGSKTGVFIGACFSESEKTWFYEKLQVNGFGITGCSRAMFANRISYFLGVNGPSYTVDSACSSSLTAMEHAYRAIRDGLCESAIVGGANLCLHPFLSLQFSRLGHLSPDGRCRCFDNDADGYARSEAIAVVYLQKAKDARRIYATFVHAKTNCDGFKEQGITFPSSHMQTILLKDFYQECGIPPTELSYIEAHASGSKIGDPEEVLALDSVFCKDRKTPLKIGSVKSNLGHSSPSSGLCSIAKVIIAMESRLIPPNLHYNKPREGVKALEDGRLTVVTESTPWEGGYVGINSFGFGGANCHVLLKSHNKEKVNNGAPNDDLPRLVVVSGRTEEGVTTILNDIESRMVDVEYIAMHHDVYSEDIPGHLYRGYTILEPREVTDTHVKEIEHYPGAKRPIWFVFSGMGSQWPGMGEALLHLPIFAAAIKKCDSVLKPRGIDIYDILTNKDKKTFDNILNSFVGIAAVQIGLVDILTAAGIVPDNIIGHSVGELGCAYADGCFTAEQMILSAYSRGKASVETEIIFGSMAAVGLGYKDLKDMCPADIEIACHNGPGSSTISGPAESMKNFVAELQEKKIFAREVPCSNIPYHSRYIAAMGPKLLAYLQEVIPEPKARSPKWMSTSVPRNEWNTAAARLSSADYHTNNLLSSVLFEETSYLIPKDAVTIEIAPHGLLQAILRRSLHPGVKNVAMAHRGHRDNTEVVFQALGKLYNAGLQPQLKNLYPEVPYPVSRGTPMISPHIRWEHSDDWYVTSYRLQKKVISGERLVQLSLAEEDYAYMAGHVIDGQTLIPATGYLQLIWETFGIMRREEYTDIPIVFEDVKFLKDMIIPEEGIIELTLMLQKGSGRFEVVDGKEAVVTGTIRNALNPTQERMNVPFMEESKHCEELLTEIDIYKELSIRGYHYTGLFRGIKRASIRRNKGHITWASNWVAFMDSMLQMQVLASNSRRLLRVTGIQKLVIDTKFHSTEIEAMNSDEKQFPVSVYPELDCIVCGGVEIRGLKANAVNRMKLTGEPVLEQYRFIAHVDRAEINPREFIQIACSIVVENHLKNKMKTIELIDEEDKFVLNDLLSVYVEESINDMPLIQADVNIVTNGIVDKNQMPKNLSVIDPKKLGNDTSAQLAIGCKLLTKNRGSNLIKLLSAVQDGGFIVSREDIDGPNPIDSAQSCGVDVIMEKRFGKELLVLFRKNEKVSRNIVVIHVNDAEFAWVAEMQAAVKTVLEHHSGNARILLVGSGECTIMGIVKSLRKEPGGEIFRGLLIQDPHASSFSLKNPIFAKQLQLDLAINVLGKNGVWGTYRYLPLKRLEMIPVHHAFVDQQVLGDLSTMNWHEGQISLEIKDSNIIRVFYSSINFRDVMLSTGKMSVEVIGKTRQTQEIQCAIGSEYSGIDHAGRKVMGMVRNRGLSNLILADKDLSWYVPDNWSLEDAATVPVAYATAYYALYIHGNMQKGDKVLIHAGSGGVGQAAINIALSEGCEVFTTVGTPEKRKFIHEKFPQIPENHIYNSRDTSFEPLVIRQTKKRGVDIVLNSLSAEKLQASVRCLAKGGRFLEIGNLDIAANSSLGMEIFLKEVSFQGVQLDNIFEAPIEKKLQLKKFVSGGLSSGAIRPLNRTVFRKDQLEHAFRHMAAGNHIGKCMIKIRDEDEPINAPILAYPRYHCLDKHSYVILGGLGGIGLELTDWLILRGAKNIVLVSRRGVRNGYQKMKLELWESYGINVVIVTQKDASKKEDCEFILNTATKLGPVDGIFNLAAVLKDRLFENQSPTTFKESFHAKTWSTKQLDQVSRKICPRLRHFVAFSSVCSGRGNAGQTNYSMANAVMESICEKRAAEGFPSLAIQWGTIGSVGLVADMQEDHKELIIAGIMQQKISSCLQQLDGFLQQKHPIVSSLVVAKKQAGGSGATSIVSTVLNIMGLNDLTTINQHRSLSDLGMDSMMAIEIKQTVEREFGIFLTAQDFRSLNFATLSDMAAKEAEAEKKRQSEENADTLSGIKLLVRTLGLEGLNQETCLKLETKEEVCRREIFLIPGIDGYGQIFSTFASWIKSPATCLQYGMNYLNQRSIEALAHNLLPHTLKKIEERRNFVIAGYSFGALIAIELARKLEAEGLSGRLVLIDGAPEQMKAIMNQQLASENVDELENIILLGLTDIFLPSVSSDLALDLKKCKSWEKKVDAFVSRSRSNLKKDIEMSDDILRGKCTAIYYRLLALQEYDISKLPPIRAPIVLLKPTMPSVQGIGDIGEDYGLGKVTRDRVTVHEIEGNHVTMMSSQKIAFAINDDPLMDPVEFMTSITEGWLDISCDRND